MTTCPNHPAEEAVQPCGRCQRPFCDRCRVELVGQQLCQECKAVYLSELLGPAAGVPADFGAVPPARRVMHPHAMLGLVVPVLGSATFFCSPVTGLIGLWLSARALREINANPIYQGRTVALVGVVVSGGILGTWILALAATLLFRVTG